jgi:hypothetical protein
LHTQFASELSVLQNDIATGRQELRLVETKLSEHVSRCQTDHELTISTLSRDLEERNLELKILLKRVQGETADQVYPIILGRFQSMLMHCRVVAYLHQSALAELRASLSSESSRFQQEIAIVRQLLCTSEMEHSLKLSQINADHEVETKMLQRQHEAEVAALREELQITSHAHNEMMAMQAREHSNLVEKINHELTVLTHQQSSDSNNFSLEKVCLSFSFIFHM